MASTDWEAILQTVEQGINALAPIISVALPGSGVAINLVERIAQGVIAAEPSAVALFKQINSGGGVTQEQLTAYINDNDAANAQLQADIATKLAALGG